MRDIKSEVLAKEWAKLTLTLSGEGELFEDGELSAAKVLDEILDPPTLSGVIFEPLVGAVTDTGDEVVTMSERGQGVIDCYFFNRGKVFTTSAIELYPNGKRYKIVEDGGAVSSNESAGGDQPERPEILTSLSEYSNAPSGTIVFASDSLPLIKMRSGDWTTGVSQYPVRYIAGISRKVARWGWKL